MCRAGERGGVVIAPRGSVRTSTYDRGIVSFEQYLHGFASADLAFLIGTRKLQRALERCLAARAAQRES